jgi:choline dehydrogenase-like flavoprotein
MGAAGVGYRLAQEGQNVLFLEKGPLRIDGIAVHQEFAESYLNDESSFETRKEVFRSLGRFWEPIHEMKGILKDPRAQKLFPMLGSGLGGSSAIYGMVLERFFPSDFENTHWPFRFSEIEPFYQEAEKIFEVHGEADPLKSPQSFPYANRGIRTPHPINEILMEHLREKKLHPYLLPLANKKVPDCMTCQGFLCSKKCKKDAWNTLIQPALKFAQTKLFAGAEVISLVANSESVSSAIVQVDDQRLNIRGKRFILGAGAIFTPKLLLQSVSQYHPKGIGNRNSVVGRYLMRHLVDLYALKFARKYGQTGRAKEIGLNDFYLYQNTKFGNIQSFGALPNENLLARSLIFKLRQNNHHLSAKLVELFQPIVKLIIKQITQPSTLIAATMEDEPSRENFVTFDESGNIYIKYNVSSRDRDKLERFRDHVLNVFQPFRPRIIKMAESNEMLGHLCGTCRMGTDPQSSVVDRHNKVHGMENLFIVDSSFLPTSGGTNPALTLVANGLRVAAHIIETSNSEYIYKYK